MADRYWDKIEDLVRRLDHATEIGQLNWEASFNSDAFQVDVGTTTISISSRDRDGTFPFELVIQSGSGSIIDSFTTDEDLSFNDTIGELFHKARRNANGADRAIDEILQALPEIPSATTSQIDPWEPATPSKPRPTGGYDDEPPF